MSGDEMNIDVTDEGEKNYVCVWAMCQLSQVGPVVYPSTAIAKAGTVSLLVVGGGQPGATGSSLRVE